MSALIFEDATLESSTREHSSLIDATQLILEISINGRIVSRANLLSHKSSSVIWKADQALILSDVGADFMISVLMELGGTERQVLGFMELNVSELYEATGNQYEIPLICEEGYQGLILKTKVLAGTSA